MAVASVNQTPVGNNRDTHSAPTRSARFHNTLLLRVQRPFLAIDFDRDAEHPHIMDQGGKGGFQRFVP